MVNQFFCFVLCVQKIFALAEHLRAIIFKCPAAEVADASLFFRTMVRWSSLVPWPLGTTFDLLTSGSQNLARFLTRSGFEKRARRRNGRKGV